MNNRRIGFILVLLTIALGLGSAEPKKLKISEDEIQRRLKQHNKPPFKSIQSPDGDIIDCIVITEQPAFDDPLLRNHTIQMRPSSHIEDLFKRSAMHSDNAMDSEVVAQLWRMNGECPENTVPIRRLTKEDLLRGEKYGKKYQNTIQTREYAVVSVRGGTYNGGKAWINVWNPEVQEDAKGFSLAQIWVVNGVRDFDLHTLEAGWQVAGGKNDPRLFTFWTRDSYKDTGCYNLECPGFVQTSNAFALGASIKPISTYGGSQYGITLLISKDPKTGNWWLGYEDKVIGYWPGSIVPKLANGASRIDWGGEVTYEKTNGQHTTTDMGSGHFADEGFQKASYFRNLGVVDTSNVLRDPGRLGSSATNPTCYNLNVLSSKDWGTYFYYGGPGQNPRCQ